MKYLSTENYMYMSWCSRLQTSYQQLNEAGIFKCVLTRRPIKIKVCLEMMMLNMDFSPTKLLGVTIYLR